MILSFVELLNYFGDWMQRILIQLISLVDPQGSFRCYGSTPLFSYDSKFASFLQASQMKNSPAWDTALFVRDKHCLYVRTRKNISKKSNFTFIVIQVYYILYNELYIQDTIF